MSVFGAKIQLTVDENQSKLSGDIQRLVEQASKGTKLEIHDIEATKAINEFRKELMDTLNKMTSSGASGLQKAFSSLDNTLGGLNGKLSEIGETVGRVEAAMSSAGTAISGMADQGAASLDRLIQKLKEVDGLTGSARKKGTGSGTGTTGSTNVDAQFSAQIKQLDSMRSSIQSALNSMATNGSFDTAEIDRLRAAYNDWLVKIEEVRSAKVALSAEQSSSLQQEGAALQQQIAGMRQQQAEVKATGATLKSLSKELDSINNKELSKIADPEALQAFRDEYQALKEAIASTQASDGATQVAATAEIQAATAALREKIAAQLAAEQAANRTNEAERRAAAESEAAATREANLTRQTATLKSQITGYINQNSKAYQVYGQQIDRILNELSSGNVDTTRLAQLRAEWAGITAQAREAGVAGQTFFEKLKAGWAKFGGWSIVTKSMMTVVRGLRQMIDAVKEQDAALTELRKVTDLTAAGYDRFYQKAAQTAQEIGATVSDTINATADFARLGFNVDDASSLAEAALIYKNVGDGIDDISQSTESLISTIKAFGYEAEDAMSIVDMFNEVGKVNCPVAQ